MLFTVFSIFRSTQSFAAEAYCFGPYDFYDHDTLQDVNVDPGDGFFVADFSSANIGGTGMCFNADCEEDPDNCMLCEDGMCDDGATCWCNIAKISPIPEQYNYYFYADRFDDYSSCQEICAYRCADQIVGVESGWEKWLESASFCTYPITFKKQGGSGGDNEIYSLASSGAFLDPDAHRQMTTNANEVTIPARAGYSFLGYYNAANGSTRFIDQDGYITASGISAASSYSSDAEWHAKWSAETYTITLNDSTNGGSGGTGIAKEVYATKWTNNSGTTITSVAIPTKSNSVFLGYYTGTTGGTQKIPANGVLPSNTTFTSSTTLKAQFGGCTCTKGTNVSTCTVTGVTDNKCQYSYTCNTGYNTSGTFEGAVATANNTSPNCTPGAMKITLHKQGGTGTIKTNEGIYTGTNSGTMTCTTGTSVSLPTWDSNLNPGTTNITNTGKVFLGWSTDDTCTTSSCVSTTQITCPTTGAEYFAVWQTCNACNTGSNCTCSLNVVNNVCTYTTGANSCYYVSSGANTYSPVCTIYSPTITVDSRRGVSAVTAKGWTNSGTATMTKSCNCGSTINLSTVTPTFKSCYNTIGYTLTSGSGSLSGTTYTCGTGNATITAAATAISTDASLAPASVDKIYNYTATTLTASGSSCDSAITKSYKFGVANSSNGTYSYGDFSGMNEISIPKNYFLGTKYFKAQVSASDGTLTSSVATSNEVPVTLKQKAVTFVQGRCGQLSGTQQLYARYEGASLYTSATGTVAGTIPTASESNATFNGWYTAQSGGKQVYDASGVLQASVAGYTNSTPAWIITGPTSLYARYICSPGYSVDNNGCCLTANTCTVTFKSGDKTLGTQSFTYGTAQQLTSVTSLFNVPVSGANGWSFEGWATTTGTTTTTYADKQSLSTLCADGNNITLYGVWTRPIQFRYYNSATATSVTTDNRTQYYYNTNTTNAAAGSVSTYALYTQSNYNWAPSGWATSSTATLASVSQTGSTTTTVTPAYNAAAPTYYAVYSRTPQISYNANSGSGTTSSTNCGTQTYNAGGSAGSSSSCTLASNGFTTPLSGYNFYRWGTTTNSTTGTGSGGSYTFPNTAWASLKTTMLYAIWNTQITLDKNSGSGTIQGESGTTNAAIRCTYGVSCDFGNTSTLSYTGYTFNGGWGTSNSCTATTTSFTNPTGTYYACKSANTINLHWYEENGTTQLTNVPIENQTCTYGDNITLPTEPTRPGYTFLGWEVF